MIRAGLAIYALLAGCGLREVPAGAPSSGQEEPMSKPSARDDLLRCPLQVTAHALGKPGDGPPSAPVPLGDGFVAAFVRTDASGSALYTQRISADGHLAPPILVRRNVHASRPSLASAQGYTYAIALDASGAAEAILLDPATGDGAGEVMPLATPPEDVSFGPRGLACTDTEGGERRLRFAEGGEPILAGPAPASWPEPREQILASGPSREGLLVRHGDGASFVTVAGGRASEPRLLFEGASPTWTEASLAAGPSGFAIVRTGPEIADLELYLADADGVLRSAPVPISDARAAGEARVRRYPRAAALGSGWAVSYWDGTGPVLLRLDADGAPLGEPIPLRSGDERGGHTDARMAATDGALAVTWQVEPPLANHGFPEEQPERPGPRLAILTCAR